MPQPLHRLGPGTVAHLCGLRIRNHRINTTVTVAVAVRMLLFPAASVAVNATSLGLALTRRKMLRRRSNRDGIASYVLVGGFNHWMVALPGHLLKS